MDIQKKSIFSPSEEAIKSLLAKIPITRLEFDQLRGEMRNYAFTVAGTLERDVIEKMQGYITKAMQEGWSLGKFKKGFSSENMGLTGITPYRLETIYRTNISNAYNASRCESLTKVTNTRPYWQYMHGAPRVPRPAHAAMHLRVMRHDDPFWATGFPPNGFCCTCTVRSLSAADLKKYGHEVKEGGLPDVVEAGFDYNPSYGSWMRQSSADMHTVAILAGMTAHSVPERLSIALGKAGQMETLASMHITDENEMIGMIIQDSVKQQLDIAAMYLKKGNIARFREVMAGAFKSAAAIRSAGNEYAVKTLNSIMNAYHDIIIK